MDKNQALYSFWSGFDLNAYDPESVPDEAVMPYITYETRTGKFSEEVQATASLWYRSTSWEAISKKADEIGDAIGLGGATVKYDGGMLWIKRANAFAQRMTDEDLSIRRIILTTQIEYIEG